MEQIGKLLRETRTENNITLDEISKKTKIQKKYLHALEEGNFSVFSGEIYIKGALRNYAQATGLNAEEILFLYNKVNKKKFLENKEHQPASKEHQPVRMGHDVFFAPQRRKIFSGVALTWIVILTFVFAGSIWYLYGLNYAKNKGTPQPANYLMEGNEKQVELSLPDPGSPPPENLPLEKAALTLVSEGNGEIIYALGGVKEAEINLKFVGRCWMRILQDEVWIEEKIFGAGESKSLRDAQETLLHFGNPPAARITVNGLEIDSLPGYNRPVKITIKKE